MPYFTRQVAQNGNLLVVAFVGVSEAKRQALVAAGQPIPPPVQIQAIIDTGASDLCVDPSVLSQLGLTPTGVAQVNTPSSGTVPVQQELYDVSFFIPASTAQVPLSIQTMPALSCELLVAQGFHALVGRSVLKGCLLTYDGQAGLFSLAY